MSRIIRLSHRWLAPVFIIVMLAVISTQGSSIAPIVQRVQQVMVVFFALSGLYLFSMPWWVKWRRARQRAAGGAPARRTTTTR